MTYDVVVIGQGAMGSAALYHLARRGVRVLALEQFERGHDRGSSHGQTRVIRLGYFEHPSYVPLAHKAYALWRDLEAASGQSLLHITGIAEMGRPDSVLVTGTLASSRQHNLTHTVLDAAELMRRYPAFTVPRDFVAVIQPEGGFVEAERSILAHQNLAISAGAEIRFGEKVHAVEPQGGGVRVRTSSGIIEAGATIVAAGPWATELLPDLPLPLRPTRQVLLWVDPLKPELFTADRFPVFMIDSGPAIHYGFPLHPGEGLKIAKHHHEDETIAADGWNRTVSAKDEALIRTALKTYLPMADGQTRAAKTCVYTMTDDGDFVLDHVPGSPQIVLASPCSGHGLKFSPVIGEILADLALNGGTGHDIARFRFTRG